ncbi:MAG: enoyl-CoA hydratase/isomerase family protein [Rhodospirillales bacterium]|nr:enoyl-CoA hydratase/isomerase family protein [Rhodospirillales bacterium]
MDGIDLIIGGRVAHVVLNRPKSRNAFDSKMLAAYEDAMTVLDREREVEVVVLRAEGPSFCSGTDLKELENFDADDTLHWQRRASAMVERWARLVATTVTAYNGPAIGSGAVIGLASDVRLAADTSSFTFPEVDFGMPLTWSGIPILTMLLGAERAKRLLLFSETLDAAELKRLDLVMEVVTEAELETATGRIVDQLLAAPLISRSMTKRAVLAAAAAPGFTTNLHEPFLASLSIYDSNANGKGV